MSISTTRGNTVHRSTRMFGAFKDYLTGLDILRNDLKKKEDNFRNILSEFYKINGNEESDSQYRKYLLSISNGLDVCNNVVKHNNPNQQITIDSYVSISQLVALLKDSLMNLDVDTFETIIDFSENINYSLELIQIIIDNLDKDIYSKLKFMYSCSSVTETVEEINSCNDQVKIFVTEISNFSKSLPEKMMRCRQLIKSCATHMRISLLDRSVIADQLLCDVPITRYPLLRVMPDMEFKLNEIFRICRNWLDREETFILNINQQIRERRLLAKEKESRILSARDHQRNVLKSLKTSYILCQNSKIKMNAIVKELQLIESQIKVMTIEQKQIGEEKYKTQSMAEFLTISISQTRKNYSLQMKKQRLEAQVGELETTLHQLDAEISMLKQEMIFKSNQKVKTRDKLQTVEKIYLNAKSDLESYSQSLSNYKTELISIKQSLITIEGLKLLKSSPEFVENVFGEIGNSPNQSVQFAPSLLNAINIKTHRNKKYYIN